MERASRLVGRQNRRQLLKGVAGLGVAAASSGLLAGCANQVAPFFSASAAAGKLETTRIRLSQIAGTCVAPQYIARELLRAEGFTEVEYVQVGTDPFPAFAAGAIDVAMVFVAPFMLHVEQGVPVVLLGGVHVGCFELFGTDSVRTILDVKGKTVGIPGLGTTQHVFLATMAAYVGLNPNTDINWHIHAPAESAQVLNDGTVDALIGFAPVPQELRTKKIGHVVVNSATDRPWSQYFCCTLGANRPWAEQHPVAAKRALRAILKAADICANEPERVARQLMDGGFTSNYDYALQSMNEIPYNRWREYDPEDAVRFYALRLHEIGMIRSTPEQIINQGTNWKYFNELKQELKS